jgi:hypothetical protein
MRPQMPLMVLQDAVPGPRGELAEGLDTSQQEKNECA